MNDSASGFRAPASEVDLVSDLLRVVRLEGTVFFQGEFSAPFGVATPEAKRLLGPMVGDGRGVITFHVVSVGELWVELESGPSARLRSGSVAILPGGEAHHLSSRPAATPVPAGDLMPPPPHPPLVRVRHGGGGPITRITCGYLRYDGVPFNPGLRGLPPLLAPSPSRWLHALLDRMGVESAPRRRGGAAALARISELLFVEAVRDHIEELPEAARGWLAGTRDAYVGRALCAMHAEPAHAWTVASLAREAGLSRSSFAARFTALLGISPIHYLGQWRLTLAAQILRTGDVNVVSVADQVGYRSEAAFSRAFKAHTGVSPSAWRRRGAEAPSAREALVDE